jgi:hypothetical protein
MRGSWPANAAPKAGSVSHDLGVLALALVAVLAGSFVAAFGEDLVNLHGVISASLCVAAVVVVCQPSREQLDRATQGLVVVVNVRQLHSQCLLHFMRRVFEHHRDLAGITDELRRLPLVPVKICWSSVQRGLAPNSAS